MLSTPMARGSSEEQQDGAVQSARYLNKLVLYKHLLFSQVGTDVGINRRARHICERQGVYFLAKFTKYPEISSKQAVINHVAKLFEFVDAVLSTKTWLH